MSILKIRDTWLNIVTNWPYLFGILFINKTFNEFWFFYSYLIKMGYISNQWISLQIKFYLIYMYAYICMHMYMQTWTAIYNWKSSGIMSYTLILITYWENKLWYVLCIRRNSQHFFIMYTSFLLLCLLLSNFKLSTQIKIFIYLFLYFFYWK